MAKMKILLVEDEARLATAVRRVLDEEGYATDWAADGADGLSRAENNE
jgi:two-component system OmpR family response regulator